MAIDPDRFGPDVAVDEPFAMGGIDCFRQRRDEPEGLSGRESVRQRPLSQRLALDRLGRGEQEAALESDLVERHDVSVLK